MGVANHRSLHPQAGAKSAGRHIILGQFSTKRIKSESPEWRAWFQQGKQEFRFNRFALFQRNPPKRSLDGASSCSRDQNGFSLPRPFFFFLLEEISTSSSCFGAALDELAVAAGVPFA